MDAESQEPDQNRSTGDLVLPVFPLSGKPCVNVWMDKLSKGILTATHFKEHWRIWVPKIYSPEPNTNILNWTFDEEDAQKLLYNTLEEFICNGDPCEVLKQLRENDDPPSVCGRVFKMGEPTYFCRECGMDPTCVLCVSCFKESVHQNHKYKMGTSNGGGCCDCGDCEAWKKNPFCKTHAAGVPTKDSSSKKLPEDIALRATATFEAVLKYCFELLTLEHTPGLPFDLQVNQSDEDPLSIGSDVYCTVLFNDEAHTFEQVINTLMKVTKCSHKDAIDYVTNIDRDGRTVVKCSLFQHCNELKASVERFTSRHSTRPLKALVVHSHVVAHQTFAMKLLDWLRRFISMYDGFRIIFSDVALNMKPSNITIVEGILMRDSQLWKSARTAWHRLFISGMMMEYESKKALAIVFTQHYGTVMKDFIRDDQDHSFSITSLSVQLYTVPTLAHHLIAHHDVLFILLNTFISESSRRCNAVGRLEFDRNTPNQSFKRAQYIIHDLRYLLASKPDTWTDELRRGFLGGLSLLLNLLASMQWMDAVQRQVGQHMEYEPEWESAFNLHIKLSPVISLALEWCGTDKIVLTKAVRMVSHKLWEQPGNDPFIVILREVADHSAACLHYDVSSEAVSIHLPLSRFLAGLFLHLEKFGLNYQSNEFVSQRRPSAVQIIEPVLRAQAMISQVHAGMWRRNGYSLLNQLFFYHNVRCRTEMLDRDIVLLQVGASIIESNEFLVHILNKFNLINWTDPEFETNSLNNPEEDSTTQTINLVEEFLGLMIVIIGERHVPGIGEVTADDRVKKDIIQQLCIKPLPHSELNRTLPEGIHHETGLERVIDSVADFKKPSTNVTGKGVYELKPHLYDEYNVFYYHYTKEELSRSEEAQRKRRKTMNELECCPPPKLVKLTESFSLVANLLQCDIMFKIMQTVLERALNLRARTFSEPQIHKVLHLIGYGLQEEESGNYPFLIFIERAQKWKIFTLLEELSGSRRIDAHRDLLAWVLGKYRSLARVNTMVDDEKLVAALKQQAESSTEEDPAKINKEWRTKMAAQKRAKVMAQMAAMQNHFMKKNAELFKEAAVDADKSGDQGSSMDLTESLEQVPIAVGSGQTARLVEEQTYTCILCQEDQTVKNSGKAMVLAAFVQKSTVFCQDRLDPRETHRLYLSSKLGASPHTSTCGHVMHAACWQKYFDNVLSKESRRPYRARQPASFDVDKLEFLCPLCECLSNTILPVLPALGIIRPTESRSDGADLNFETWLKAMRITLESMTKEADEGEAEKVDARHHNHDEMRCRYCQEIQGSLQALPTAEEELLAEEEPPPSLDRPDNNFIEPKIVVCPFKKISQIISPTAAEAIESLYAKHDPVLSEHLMSMIHLYARATFSEGLGISRILSRKDDTRVPLLAWKSTAYTIHGIEFLLRDANKPLFGALTSRQRDSLECLARISAAIGSTWPDSRTTGPTTLGVYAITLLSMLLDNPHTGDCLTEWDSFGVLVPLMTTLPSLFNSSRYLPPSIITGGIREAHALKLVFYSHIVKILATTEFTASEPMEIDGHDQDRSSESCESIGAFMNALGLQCHDANGLNEIWQTVKDASLPFLRCCALYFHYVTDVPAPMELTNRGGDTYENLCTYLGLPTTCNELLDSDVARQLGKKWMEHPRARRPTIVKEPLKVNRLLALPHDYSDLINMVSLFTCPKSDREDSRNPTMCLVCGQMLCSQSYCCQMELDHVMVGACTYHASKCGSGVGIFLRVRECEILFLRSPNRGAFACPPYLDEYGETDQGLRRGYPLKLCDDKYKQLNLLWLGHGLHEAIARAIEASSNHMSTQWQHL